MKVDSLFNEFASKRILVLGDVMVDAYLRGSVSRVSPEAPVPIVNLSQKEERLGGAANVARNLLSMGADVMLCSVIGNDLGAQEVLRLMDRNQLSLDGIVTSDDRKTSIKTRIIGNNQHIIRVDDEEITPLTKSEEDDLVNKVRGLVENGVDAIILEDYNKGVLTKRVIEEVVAIANENGVVTTVDPKKDNFFAYKNVTLFKPNLQELKEGFGVDFDFVASKDKFESIIVDLENQLNNEITFVTLSEFGVFVKDKKSKHYDPAHIRTISDVSGAGDTVISMITLCLCVGLDAVESAKIANLSGGLVCEVSGVVPISKEMLRSELENILE